MKKIISLEYKQIKELSWLKTPIGTIWKSHSIPENIFGHFITPKEDIEEAPLLVNLDIFDDEDIWVLLTKYEN